MAIKIALVGNPNCGKTTLFNILTGSRQYVGNWPGVTVEKKIGKSINNDCEIIDLPGVYSLSPYSMEEIVTRDCVLSHTTQAIINIIDGTNIERNLYLTTQLLELKKPMIIVINMMDEVAARGEKIDCNKMSAILNVPVIPISAKKGLNIENVVKRAENAIENKKVPFDVKYNQNTQNAINDILCVLAENDYVNDAPLMFYCSKLLEGDRDIKNKLFLTDSQKQRINSIGENYEKTEKYGDKETMLADARYHFITDKIISKVKSKPKHEILSMSNKIDKVMTNRFLALPIFALIMLFIFMLTFGTVGTTLQGLFADLFNNKLSGLVRSILDASASPQWTYGLLIDAIIGGIGGILSFLPQITILFLCLSILEDSGYMSRAAFIMDCLLKKIGLSGKSFIPMLMGFGCTTPAVMAARTMENEKERRITIMLTPFMSCGARLPIYALFAGAFFKEYQGLVVFSMYALGVVVAILIGLILKKTIFKSLSAPFVLELPPYRMPSIRSLIMHVWEKVKDFIVKAGTLIFAMSVVIWLCQNFSFSLQIVSDSKDSILGVIGSFISPIFKPLGFASWEITVSLFSGLIAKESVVSSLSVLLVGGSSVPLSEALSNIFTPISAYAFMAFTLLYVPCISAFAAIRREMNSVKWTVMTVILQLGTAYIVSFIIYQIGSLIIYLVN